jgi:hypothetical protein
MSRTAPRNPITNNIGRVVDGNSGIDGTSPPLVVVVVNVVMPT